MKKILSQIWNGELEPFEECTKVDSRMRELHKISDELREKLTQGMSEEQLKALEAYDDSVCDEITYSMEKSILYGVKFAVGFLTEALH